MADVKIGSTSFNEDSLKGITLSEAYVKFEHLRKDIVRAAYEKVNPKRVKKSQK